VCRWACDEFARQVATPSRGLQDDRQTESEWTENEAHPDSDESVATSLALD
jgi:hypothetical protein